MYKTFAGLAAVAAMVQGQTWSENFDEFNLNTWQHEITMGGGGNWEFEMYYNNRTSSWVEDGILYLEPIMTEDVFGHDAVYSGSIDIWGASPADQCTGNAFYGCSRSQPASGNYVNPVMSSRVRTVESFAFKYGKVEVKAQLPKGDWIWPAIWMLPKNNHYGQWPASGEIDIMESRGNDASYSAGGNNVFASTLHFGPDWQHNAYDKTHAEYHSDASLADDFHIYGLIWNENGIKTYIDTEDNVVLDIKTDESFWQRGEFPDGMSNPWKGRKNVAPFDQEYYIIMNVAVGGTNGYFPDGVGGKPWSDTDGHAVNAFYNAKPQWEQSWGRDNHDCAMKIDYVNVWETDPSGNVIEKKDT
jgi:beta-glucanase (GH16 family)